MSKLSMQRWKALQATTPSGRSTFVCINCGRITDAPQDKCPADAYKPSERAKAQAGTAQQRNFRTEVPCYLYPMTESQYKKLNKKKFLFHGSIISPDGEMRTVNIELEFDSVKEIFAREAEIDFELAADAAEEIAKDVEQAQIDEKALQRMQISQQKNAQLLGALQGNVQLGPAAGVAQGLSSALGGGLAGAVKQGGLPSGQHQGLYGMTASSAVQAGQPVSISGGMVKPMTDIDKFKKHMSAEKTHADGRAGTKPKSA